MPHSVTKLNSNSNSPNSPKIVTILQHILTELYFSHPQGVQCKDCRYNAHKKCSERVPRDCTGEIPQVITTTITITCLQLFETGDPLSGLKRSIKKFSFLCYRAFHRFRQAKIANGGLVLRSSLYLLLAPAA